MTGTNDIAKALRFPARSLVAFLLTLGLTLAVASMSDYCDFGINKFNCAEWAGPVRVLLFGWCLLAVVLIPVTYVLAVRRLMGWCRLRGQAG
jgi:hypothetical protein